jgi:hypothetical protein
MKNILFASFLFISTVVSAQDKTCNLWLGEPSESSSNIQQLVEKHLEIKTKPVPAVNNNILELRDDNELVQIVFWLKPKKTLVKGAMTTVYTISSFKIVTLSDKIEELYSQLSGKVLACTTETVGKNTVFGDYKMFIDKNSGGFGKKATPLWTLTVTAK